MIDWLACALVRTIGAVLCRVPPSVAVWCGERAGILASWLSPKRTHIGELNLRAAFDGRMSVAEGRRTIRACYKQLGAGMIELLRLPVIDAAYIDRYVTIEGQHHFEAAVASGSPVVFLTGHYGNWELSSIVAALKGYPIMALARAQDKLPKLYKLLVSYRESKGCTIVHKGGAMKRLIAALEHQQFVGIVGDQVSRQGIFVEFFGRPALFATGPFELAHSKGALILPAFIRRVHGPFHQLTLESPFTLSKELPKDAAVRQGIERFAALLARHITERPAQWLWMHKRWKHTPARRVLVLSDGKAGHVKQSLAVVEAMREQCAQVTHDVVDIRYRSRWHRILALLWSWWLPGGAGAASCLRWTLTPESGRALLSRYADLIVSCGSSTAPANLLWSRDNRAKSIVLMNPAPLPLQRFDLVIAPQHDHIPPRPNVVHIAGALSQMHDDALLEAQAKLQAHPNFQPDVAGVWSRGTDTASSSQHPMIGVFLGGDTFHYDVSTAFAEALLTQVAQACEALDGGCLVTTSRRTSAAVERLVSERLAAAPRCRLVLIASRDAINGTMEGMLGSADVAVVTGESTSMVSEACASGRHVVVVEPPRRYAKRGALTKHQRFLQHLVAEGYIRLVPVNELGVTIHQALRASQPARRLDNVVKVRDAVARLLLPRD